MEEECSICCLRFDPQSSEDIYRLETCGHPVHRHDECFPRGVVYSITNTGLMRPRCNPRAQVQIGPQPVDEECDEPLTDNDVLELADEELLRKLKLAEAERSTPSLRSCPNSDCGWSKVCDPNTKRIVCEDCNTEFCYVHGAACQASGDQSLSFESRCDAYMSQKDYVLNEDMMRQERKDGEIKQCPSCKADVMKMGGCNAMTCSLCGTGFCWLCGEEIQDAEGLPVHFMRWNTTSPCAGKQFEGMDGETDAFGAIELNCCERLIQINLLILIFFILLPFLLVACILGCMSNCLFDLALRACVEDTETRLFWRTRCQYVFVFLIVFPGLLASAVLWVPWFCYLRWKVQRMQQQLQQQDGFDPDVMQQVRQASVEEHEREAQRRASQDRRDYGTLQHDEENPYVESVREGSAPESQPLIPPAATPTI